MNIFHDVIEQPSYLRIFNVCKVIMGGGRRYFMRFDQRDPEHGSNAHYGRRDGRDLIQVVCSWCNNLPIIEYTRCSYLCFTIIKSTLKLYAMLPF